MPYRSGPHPSPLLAIHVHSGTLVGQISDEELTLLEAEALRKAETDRIKYQALHDFYVAQIQWEIDAEDRRNSIAAAQGVQVDVAKARRLITSLLSLYPQAPRRLDLVRNDSVFPEKHFYAGCSRQGYLGFEEL
ncbi:hypothetical protein BC830DRAFT_1174861 [Chytriomyces sp. MP71]|nr:hypothetical protein BC830DRAFT_1174861 [Chytriomyces sp. MP71]